MTFSQPHPIVEVARKDKTFVYVVLDSGIAKKLKLDEETCRFEQSISESGDVILRLKRKVGNALSVPNSTTPTATQEDEIVY